MKKETWYLILDRKRSPYENMAFDELLLEESCRLDKPLLRFYGWDRKSASIGYIQKFSAVEDQSYTVVRRPTGGGVVFHDVDLTYTVAVPKGHYIEKLNRVESYHIFHRAVIKALYFVGLDGALVSYETTPKDRMTSQCFVAPTKYDVVLNDEKSSKAAGAAQRRTKYGILHQGSIVLDGIDSFSENLTKYLIDSFAKEFNLDYEDYDIPAEFICNVEKLANIKYSSEAWNKMR